MKEYIMEELEKTADANKKKFLDLESSMRKAGLSGGGDKSPASGMGRGRGRLS